MKKEDFDKIKMTPGAIKMEGGVVCYERTADKKDVFTFFIKIILYSGSLEMESSMMYEDEKEAEVAAQDFIMLYPMYYSTGGVDKVKTLLDKYKMCKAPDERKTRPTLSLVK